MLFEDTYNTIESSAVGIYKDKGSKFLAFAFPVSSEIEIKEHLTNLRKEHPSARHHCYAFRLGADKQAYRANDDGEPSNTAGKPILGQIQSKDLTNILIVVARYFGGTLLGVSKLISAYRNAAADALYNSPIVERTVNDFYEIKFEYAAMNNVMKILKDEKANLIKQNFNMNCIIQFSIRRSYSLSIENQIQKLAGVKINYLKSG